MKMLEVDSIISVSAVGSMKPDILPGDVVIPDQFIDFTKKRNSSFFGDGLVAHVSMADPVCSYLSEKLYRVVESLDARVIEGPQFSSRSESNLYRSWGVDVIGMTNMPEAKLAKEAEICYSSLALSTDYDCWHEGHDDVSVEDVISVLKQNTELAKQVVKKAAGVIEFDRTCKCSNALENSIITSRNSITEEIKNRYNILINKYIK